VRVLQAAGKTVDDKMFKVVQNTGVCLEMEEGRFRHLLQLQGVHFLIIE
jgi:hypothetical protein